MVWSLLLWSAASAADIFDGRINVTGDFSTYFENKVYRDCFIDETKISLVFALTTGSEANAEVISFVLPSVKLGSSSRNDGETGLYKITPSKLFLTLLQLRASQQQLC